VFSIAVNYFGGDHERAGDVVQQVFLKLFRNPAGFRGEAEFTTWLYRVTVNACIDEHRRIGRFFGLDEFFGLADGGIRQDERFQQRQVSHQVQKAIAALKPKYRSPVVLKYTEGLSYREIADVLEISIGTVSSRLNRGHAMLAKKLAHLKGQV
jgi:RNA polymerase sigma-70 factor (ECF subfamily)